MISTPNLVLKLDISNVSLSLHDDIEHVAELLSSYEISREDDIEMGRSYLRMIGRGVELSFRAGKLSSVFLYPTKGPENCGVFDGETDLLTREALSQTNANAFCDALEARGFVPPEKTYPFSVDRLNDQMRLRFEQRDGRVVVLIDDGAMIR